MVKVDDPGESFPPVLWPRASWDSSAILACSRLLTSSTNDSAKSGSGLETGWRWAMKSAAVGVAAPELFSLSAERLLHTCSALTLLRPLLSLSANGRSASDASTEVWLEPPGLQALPRPVSSAPLPPCGPAPSSPSLWGKVGVLMDPGDPASVSELCRLLLVLLLLLFFFLKRLLMRVKTFRSELWKRKEAKMQETEINRGGEKSGHLLYSLKITYEFNILSTGSYQGDPLSQHSGRKQKYSCRHSDGHKHQVKM